MRASLLPFSMEVGVCVEAYRQEAETHRRHINSAFMTFVVLDADDQPQMLPWIRPQPGVSEGRTLTHRQPRSLSAQGCGACQPLTGPRSNRPSPAPLLGYSQCYVSQCDPRRCPLCQVGPKEFGPCVWAWLIAGC